MKSFAELNLNPKISQAITELGYETPSEIQAQALPILLGDETDFLGLAATGTGKTAAFGIPLLQKIDPKKRNVQALILCPTRELALQVAGQINLLGKYLGVKAVAVYGGASFGDQVYGLREGASVVVGTPGRVVDHLERGTLSFAKIEHLVLDEADEMISMGFKDELEKILSGVPRENCKNWFFSATMSSGVRKVADTYLRMPKEVRINKTEVLSSTVEQLYFKTHESNKPELICKLIDGADDLYGLIFCQTKALVIDLTSYLSQRNYKVDCLHGDMDQNARERTMRAFREKRINVLVCTDVASRGLDVKDVTHVINYSIPREFDNYIHRIGRTARSGKAGFAMNLVTPSHWGYIAQLERITKSKMKEGKLPTRRDIGAKKITNVLAKFQDQPFFSRAVESMSEEWKQALATMPAEEAAGRFLAMMFSDIFGEQEKPAAPAPKASAPASVIIQNPPSAPPRRRFDGNAHRTGRPPHREIRGDRGGDKPAFAPRGERSDRGPRADFRDRGDRADKAAFAPRGGDDKRPAWQTKPRRFVAGKSAGFGAPKSGGFKSGGFKPGGFNKPKRFSENRKPKSES